MDKIRFRKKGQMMSNTTATMIIIIISFFVILLLFTRVNWTERIDQDTCHESLVLRSTFNLGPAEFGKNNIPIKCKTEKTCLTSGEDCSFGKQKTITEIKRGENSEYISLDGKIKLDNDPERAKQQILEIISEAMYNCNNMLGEGQLDFMPTSLTQQDYCLICNRFSLDSASKEKVPSIRYIDLYQYLGNKVDPNGKTYLESLYPGMRNWKDSVQIFNQMKDPKAKDREAKESFDSLTLDNWRIDLSKQDYVILGMNSPEGTAQKWLKVGGIGAAGVVAAIGLASIPVSGPVGIAIAGVAIKAAVAGTVAYGGYTYFYDHPSKKFKWVPPTVYPYDVQSLGSLGCSFETIP